MEQEKVNRSLAVSPRLFKAMGLFLHDAQKPQASQACWVSAEWGAQSVGHLQHHQALWEECGKIPGVIKVDSALQPVRMLFVQCNAICIHVSVFQATLLIPCGSALPGSSPKTMDWVITGGQLESQSWKQKSTRDSSSQYSCAHSLLPALGSDSWGPREIHTSGTLKFSQLDQL